MSRLTVAGVEVGIDLISSPEGIVDLSSQAKEERVDAQPEPLQLEWRYGMPDKLGLWAYSDNPESLPPRIETGVRAYRSLSGMQRWWCYLGPIPAIAYPKRMVEKQLWMIPTAVLGPYSTYYRELWLSKGAVCSVDGAIETQRFLLFEEAEDEKSFV